MPPPLPSDVGSPGRAPHRPYRGAFAAALGSALVAGVATALVDVLLTLQGATDLKPGDSTRFATVTVSLYAVAAIVIGLLQGVVAGAVRATYPDGAVASAWRRMASDPTLDRRVTGTLLAAVMSGGLYALAIAVLAMRLVGQVERKAVGALLLGVVAVGVLPVFALATYPFYRVTRWIARAVPRIGPLPATVVLVLLTLGAASSFAVLYMATRLEWGAVKGELGAPLMGSVFAIAQLSWLGLAYGPLAGVRRRVPARPAILGVAIAAALALPLVTLSGDTSQGAVRLLTREGRGVRVLVPIARKVVDRDGDGYSALLGGPDCDDRNPAVHPGAEDLPDNGIDENCNGADRTTPAVAGAGGDAAGAGTAAATQPTTQPATQPGAGRPFEWKGNIVIIAVDTLRADRLGAAGYTRRGGISLTPRMDELATKGVWFRRAYAQSPHTPRSFPSLFTSRYPSAIKWDKPFQNYPKLLDENVTVFEALRDAGFKTIGISSHFYFVPERGITQGFVEYDNSGAKSLKDSNTDIASPRTVPRVEAKLKELAASQERFVLFTHLFEPHSTYLVHEGFPYAETTNLGKFEEKYDYEIAFVDRYVGAIVDAIAAAGLTESTMIVLVSDHGEAFFVHSFGGQKQGWHGTTLYDEVMRVPLIVYAPGLEPRAIDQPVALIDVAPTLLDVVGAPIPPTFQGRSLAPGLAGQPLAPRSVHAELLKYPNWNHEMRMTVAPDGRTKVIQGEGLWELYDLEADPDERKNLWEDRPDLRKELQKYHAAWIDSEL